MLPTLIYTTTQTLLSSLFNNGFDKTSDRIYKNIKNIIYYNPEIQYIIESCDIEAKVKLFKQFLSEYNNQYKSKTIYIAIENIYNIILIINILLKNIKKILKNHTKKIFYKYRKPNYKNTLNRIKIYSDLLDKRFKLLCEINNIIIMNPEQLKIDDKTINYSDPKYISDPELSFILISNDTTE